MRIGLEEFPDLGDHILQGMTVLPGAAYLEIARAAATSDGGPPPRLVEAIRFQQLMLVPERGSRLIRTTISDGADGGRCARVSWIHEDTGSPAAVDAETTLASMIFPAVGAGELRLTLEQEDPGAIRARCPESMTGPALYRILRERGNQYGPAFRGIEELWRAGTESLARVSFPPSPLARAAANDLHPGLLDAAIQALATLRTDWSGSFAVTACGQVRIYRPSGSRGWVHARAVPGGVSTERELSGDVRLLDESGRVAAELRDLRVRHLEPTMGLEAAPERPGPSIVVAATFTAEPIEDSLSFWIQEMGLPHSIRFAPYGQVFQQLLDSASPFSRNREGVNVILVRPEDWMRGGESLRNRLDPAEKARILAGRPLTLLADGLEVVQLNAYETEAMYEEIFRERAYLRHGVSLDDVECVIDAGANIGLFTLFVLRERPAAKIYAFEPSPSAFEALQINMALHGPDVVTVPCGLSDAERWAAFTEYPRSSAFSGFHCDPSEDRVAIESAISNLLRRRGDLPATDLERFTKELSRGRLDGEVSLRQQRTISRIIEDFRIDRVGLLKIDVEKSELEVLRGIGERDWDRIGQIVVEVHDRVGTALGMIVELLERRGFRTAVEERDLLHASGLCTVYAVRPGAGAERRSSRRHDQEAWDRLGQKADELTAALRAARDWSATPYFVFTLPASRALLRHPGHRERLGRVEQSLAQGLEGLPSVHLITSVDLDKLYPVAEHDDPHGDELGHLPYTPALLTAIGTMIARRLFALVHPPYKVVVLDCDQTLWKGECGEGSPGGVEIDPARRTLQEFMVSRRDAGMLLCLCSKNREADVFDAFDRYPQMPLRRDHILSWRINWLPKSINIRSLADELRVGLDSFIFLDDDYAECAEVRANCPEVLTLQLPPQSSEIPSFLEHAWCFDQTTATQDDALRAQRCRENIGREALRRATPSFRSFLEGLELRVGVSPVSLHQVPRIAQLTQRVNQFNVTSIRRTESDVLERIRARDFEAYAVEVSDRFGDYGLVGTVFLRGGPEALAVETFLLSCRVLGKGAEHRVLARLGEIAIERGSAWVEIPWRPNGRNQPALRFLETMRGAFREWHDPSRPHGASPEGLLFRFPASHAATATLNPEDEDLHDSGRTMVTDAAPPGEGRDPNSIVRPALQVLARIPAELRDVPRIMAAVESRRTRPRPPLATSHSAPTDRVERAIAELWQKILGVDRVGIDDRFFELGGNSLKAVRAVASLRAMFGIDIPTISLFEKATIRGLAEMVRSGERREGEGVDLASRAARGAMRRVRSSNRRCHPGSSARAAGRPGEDSLGTRPNEPRLYG
jgi:FkbH-like protein/FkbM family methyltransferase